MEAFKSKTRKTVSIILIVFGCLLLLAVVFLGIRTYFEYKKIYEESQKIIEEQKKYDASNFEDSKSNYIKSPVQKEVKPGEIMQFEIFYKNTGLVAAKDLKIGISISENCTVVTKSLEGYTYEIKSGSIIISTGNLEAGKEGKVIAAFKIASPLDNGTKIDSPGVELYYYKEAPLIGKKDNFNKNISSTDVFVVKSAPDFSKSALLIEGKSGDDKNILSYGEEITYRVNIYNNGNMNVRDLEVKISGLDNLILDTDKNPDFEIKGNEAVLNLTKMDAGDMEYFYLYAKIDPNAKNNSEILPVLNIKYGQENVQKEAPLSILKLYPSFTKSNLKIAGRGSGGLYSGDVVDVTVNVTNSGNIEATNVLVDLVISNLFVLEQGERHWNIAKLAIGETATFHSSLRIIEGIIKDTYATLRLDIASDEISTFSTANSKVLVSGERPFTRNQIPIVALHGIEAAPSGFYELSTGEFDYLCGTLKALGFKTITFMDLLNYLDKGKRLPEKPVILTSDDGYQSIYNYAFPILQKYGFKMTVFLATGLIGNSDADRRLNEFDIGKSGIPVRPMLIWPEVSAMSRYGIEFMSHTVSHRLIGDLSDEEVLFELAQSKQDIESHLKKPVPFIAWPFDNFSSRAIGLLPQLGYRGAIRYKGGVEDVRSINIYAIKRIPFYSTTPTSDYTNLMGIQ
ncbi:MAG: polysaccharide deacetylase family protein [Actinobacteria bacterium]|nr:polysaccharide deacetylase family protein [Actinomycetota bacterium]